MDGQHEGMNPLSQEAITSHTVRCDEPLYCFTPGDPSTVRYFVVTSESYVDDDGDLVVDVRYEDGRKTTELTSTVGLSGERYTGTWSAICLADDRT